MERVGFSIAFTEMARAAGTSEAVKGAVMSAFYWGYAFSQVGAHLALSCRLMCQGTRATENSCSGTAGKLQ